MAIVNNDFSYVLTKPSRVYPFYKNTKRIQELDKIFEEKYLHGNVVSYGVLVQLAVDGDLEEARRVKKFMQALHIPSTLKEMEVPVEKDYLQAVLTETVTGPDMEHIPYKVTEEMIFEAMKLVEAL